MHFGNVNHKFSQRIADEISRRLADLLGVPMDRIAAKVGPSASGDRKTRANLLVLAGGFKCAVAWKASGSAAAVAMAVRSVRRFVEKSREKLIPLVATPYIGEVGQRLCQEAGVGWLDLSGNAHLVGPG